MITNRNDAPSETIDQMHSDAYNPAISWFFQWVKGRGRQTRRQWDSDLLAILFQLVLSHCSTWSPILPG
jgi:hypothetical protein